MSLDINYKLIYDLQPYLEQIRLRRSQKISADTALLESEQLFKETCAKLAGCKLAELDFSNVMCMARVGGASGHVYHIKEPARYGSPKNKCIFCGCDNVDDLY